MRFPFLKEQSIWFYLILLIILSIISIHIEKILKKHHLLEFKIIEETKFLKDIIDNTSIMIVVLDSEGKVIVFNKLCEILTGYRFEDIRGRFLYEIIPIFDSEIEFKRFLIEMKNEKESKRGINNLNISDGKSHLIAWTCSKTKDNNSIESIVITGIDITERQKFISDTMIELKNRFNEIVENATDCIVIVQDGVFRFVNTRLCKIVGYSKEELLGRPFYKLIAPEEVKKVSVNYSRRIKNEEAPPFYETTGICRDGRKIKIEINAKRIMYLGNPAVMVYIRDITERKKIEERIIYQSYLLENVGDAIIATDENFIINTWNKSAEQIYGFKKEEAVEKDFHRLLNTEFTDEEKEIFFETINKNGFFNGYVIQYYKDGSQKYIGLLTVALKDKDGKIIGYLSFNRDISKCKEHLETLSQ
ncbi:MAG: PAS domain-containing protein [bacterium]